MVRAWVGTLTVWVEGGEGGGSYGKVVVAFLEVWKPCKGIAAFGKEEKGADTNLLMSR